jgi:hypothetical protein
MNTHTAAEQVEVAVIIKHPYRDFDWRVDLIEVDENTTDQEIRSNAENKMLGPFEVVAITRKVSKPAASLSAPAPQTEDLRKALQWALEWIDAVPKDTVLPAMPGFDRDWVNRLLEAAAPVSQPAAINNKNKSTMTHEQYLDNVAIEAMKVLISKLPLVDRDGKYGDEASQGEVNKIKDDICRSAYDYAYRMLNAKISFCGLSGSEDAPERTRDSFSPVGWRHA